MHSSVAAILASSLPVVAVKAGARALAGDIYTVVEREQGKDNCAPLTSCFTLFAAPPCTADTKDRRPGATGEHYHVSKAEMP